MNKFIVGLFVATIALTSIAAPVAGQFTFEKLSPDTLSITLDKKLEFTLTKDSDYVQLALDGLGDGLYTNVILGMDMAGDLNFTHNGKTYDLDKFKPVRGPVGSAVDPALTDSVIWASEPGDFNEGDKVTINPGTITMVTPNSNVVLPPTDVHNFFLTDIEGNPMSSNTSLQVIPEPATLGLLGLMSGAICIIRRRFC